MRYPSTFLRVVSAILLCFCLLAGGTALAFRHATGSPEKTKGWLNESGFYSSVIQDQLTRLGSSAGSGVTVGSLHLSTSDLQKAIQASIPQELANKDTSSFVDGNYAWLEGKSTKPQFSIDLRPAEATFAENSSDYIAKQVDALPACSTSQLLEVEQGTADVISLGCKPPGVSGASLADLLPSFLSGTDFSQKTTFTADDLHLSSAGLPYYQQISSVPHYYQLAKHATTYLAIGAVIFIVLILITASSIAAGLQTVAWASGIAGILILLGSLITGQLEHSFENSAFNKLDLGIFKSTATNLITNMVKDAAHTELIIGLVLIGAAALLAMCPKVYALAAARIAK